MNRYTLLTILSAAFILLYFLFYHPIRIWDEASYVHNVIEMHRNGNLLIMYEDGAPSLYNTKPPFALWLQLISIKIFGINEWALRLPGILGSIIVLAALVNLIKREFDNFYAAVTFCLVYISTNGLFRGHVFLTADLDAIFLFWISLFQLQSLILVNRGITTKRLGFAFLFFTLAFFSKSTASFLVLPGIGILFLVHKKLLPVLKQKSFYLFLLLFLFLVSLYYWYVDQHNPGYWAKVWNSEFGRYGNQVNEMEHHEQPFGWFAKLMPQRWTPWLYLFPFAALFAVISRNEKMRRWGRQALFLSLFFFLVISFSKIKLEWYDAAMYPLLVLVMGIGIAEMIDRLKRRGLKIGFSLLVIALGVFGYVKNLNTWKDYGLWDQELEGDMLNRVMKKELVKKPKVFMRHEQEVFYDQVDFYLKKYGVGRESSVAGFMKGDTVVVCHPTLRKELDSVFKVRVIEEQGTCVLGVVD